MKKNILLALLSLSLMITACSSKKTDNSASNETPVDTSVEDPTTTGSGLDDGLSNATGGSTVTFKPTDWATFNTYVGVTPINSPKNIKINVNLSNVGELRFGGEIRISYEDNGQFQENVFTAGDGFNTTASTLKDNGVREAVYNYWFMNSGIQMFSGFFQDDRHGIVIVIDKSLDQGDGQGSAYVSGSIYFKNFGYTTEAQDMQRKCWFIYKGPYSCYSSTIAIPSSKTTALYPTTEGYKKLGTFTGLSKAKAFNL